MNAIDLIPLKLGFFRADAAPPCVAQHRRPSRARLGFRSMLRVHSPGMGTLNDSPSPRLVYRYADFVLDTGRGALLCL